MTNSKFRAIGFDYNGVFTKFTTSLQTIADIIGVSLEDYKKAFFEHNKAMNTGRVSYEDFLKTILTSLGKTEKLPQLLAYLNTSENAPLPNTTMLQLVDRLKSQGYKVGLLSNSSKEQSAEMRKQGLEKHFPVLLLSAEIGHQKPSPEAYNLLIKELGVKPEEMIFIDDSKESLRLSEEIGFYPLLFIGHDELIIELRSLGVNV